MTFVPESVRIQEAGPKDEYRWLVTEPLEWSGIFHGSQRELCVPASVDEPFETDLASVPRSLTWLFPRYGKYTKAAVLHDYLCQSFKKPETGSRSLLPLRDRSDADDVFRHVMAELNVPVLRRLLMWTAVSWATLLTSLVPGRRSKPVLRWSGRAVAALAVVALAFFALRRHDPVAYVAVGVGHPAGFLLAGAIGLGRADRVGAFLIVYVLTMAFSPLLAPGIVVGLVLYGYLLLEDAIAGFPAIRRFISELFSKEAKLRKLGTPQFARIAAVYES
ncbi:MAG TPA: DUF1353 domain-containing protein [Actinomycetota bacterium]|nr:DUF1353 domain-containing protein [Actinomycetota bacterium]